MLSWVIEHSSFFHTCLNCTEFTCLDWVCQHIICLKFLHFPKEQTVPISKIPPPMKGAKGGAQKKDVLGLGETAPGKRACLWPFLTQNEKPCNLHVLALEWKSKSIELLLTSITYYIYWFMFSRLNYFSFFWVAGEKLPKNWLVWPLNGHIFRRKKRRWVVRTQQVVLCILTLSI